MVFTVFHLWKALKEAISELKRLNDNLEAITRELREIKETLKDLRVEVLE